MGRFPVRQRCASFIPPYEHEKCSMIPNRMASEPLPPRRFPLVRGRTSGLEDSKQYRFRVRPVLGPEGEEQRDAWGWSPASAPASPAVLNSFLQSQAPAELVGKGKAVVSRDVLAGKVVGEPLRRVNACCLVVVAGRECSVLGGKWLVTVLCRRRARRVPVRRVKCCPFFCGAQGHVRILCGLDGLFQPSK